MKALSSRLWHSRLEASELRDIQAAKFRKYLATRVLPFSAFYRQRFAAAGVSASDIRSLEDLTKIPFTSKTDLLNTPDNPQRVRDFVLMPDEKVLRRQAGTLLGAMMHGPGGMKSRFEHEFRPLLMTSTTGRSSGPVPFLFTGHDLDILTEAGRRIMEVGDSAASNRHVNLFPFAPHLAFWQTHYAGIGHGTFCLSTGGGKVMGTDGNVGLIERIAPEVIIGMPTFIYHVLTQAVAQDRHWPQIRKIVLGGEKVPPGLRRKFRALCAELGAGRVEVLACYGFTEGKMAWMECPPPIGEETSGYHVSPDFGIIEIIDPDTLKPVPDGQAGEIVFTALDSRGTVVLRYRTGDLIEGGLSHEPCPHCGRTCPRLTGNISRVSEMRTIDTAKLKGTLVDFNELEHVLDDLEGIGPWQIELCKVNDDPFECDAVVIHAVTGRTDGRAALEREIMDRVYRAAEIHPNKVEWHTEAEMSERQGVGRLLKEEKIVDHRPRSGPGTCTGKSFRVLDPFNKMKPMVVIDGVRTPFCRAGTSLASLSAADLGHHATSALLARTGIDPEIVDHAIFGCVCQPAETANIARVIALRSGIPESVPAVTVQRNCASGLEAITSACEKAAAGGGEVFIVGGTESMSNVPLQFPRSAAGKFLRLSKARGFLQRTKALAGFRPRDFNPVSALLLGLTDSFANMNMGETAELLARDFGIPRKDQDRLAMESHLRAAAAKDRLSEEIAPVFSDKGTADTDNGVRPDSSEEALAKLRPAFDKANGSVTPGNSSQISDGAVALLVTTEDRASQLGLKPLGRIVHWAWAGCDPKRMGLGPVAAITAAGLDPAEADIVEINEAFAVQVLAVLEKLGNKIPRDRLNVNGGAIALGHPVGASGARLVLTALKELNRRGGRRALVSLCIGGGQGGALWLERT